MEQPSPSMHEGPFTLKPLPYAYDALEPYIDSRTLCFHHDKHLKAYVDNLNKALAPYPEYQDWRLPELLLHLDKLPEAIRTPVKNNAGGVYNHELYFASMTGQHTSPSPCFLKALTDSFGSYEEWKSEMSQAAVTLFGSGWAWLVADEDGHMKIIKAVNQDVPLPLFPLLPLDVWEHAYYLGYQNRRADYVDCWFSLINWPVVEKRYSYINCG